jgi:membrane protease YdiL (CAAX protease family)
MASARLLVLAGLGLWAPVALGLHLRLGLPLADGALAAALLVTAPLLALAQLPLLKHALPERVEVYASSAATLAVLTFLALVAGWRGPGLEAMGLGPAGWGTVLGGGAILFGGCLLLSLLTMGLDRLLGGADTRLMRRLIPRTPRERRLFAGVSLVAGVGEEIVYRGYLVTILSAALGGPWWALLASSLAFGMLHGYQGGAGIVRTALLGGLLGAGFVLTGSLWPAIVAHTAVDLVGGLILGPRVYPEAPPENLAPPEG